MLTREIAITPVRRLVGGAQLWGGRYDGASVAAAITRDTITVLILSDGSELIAPSALNVRWLHPASKKEA